MPPFRLPAGVCLALALAACGDDGPAPTGAVEVTTVSTGEGLDTDGYAVEVEGAGTLAIGINTTATLAEVPAGDLEIRLTRVRGNCSVQGPHPRIIRVAAGDTFRVRFDIACASTPLLDRIVFYGYRDGLYDLYSMRADGSDPVRLTATPREEREVYPAVSPDGRRILFTNRIGPEDDAYAEYLYVMDADGGNRVRLTTVDGNLVGAAAWSPDGSRIAFGSRLGEQEREIWVMDADGTGLVNLTETPDRYEVSPSWSPDGREILFISEDGMEVMRSDGTGRRILRAGTGFSSAAWSPDGRRIAFVSSDDTRSRLLVMNADGSDPAPLLPDDGGSDDAPSWSPTGDRLVLVRSLGADVDVYVVNSDGTGAVDISDNDTFEYLGAQPWGP